MKIICIGQNYVDHIEKLSNKKSGSPLIFMKPDSSLISKNQPFIIPSFSDNIHHEVELIVKINRLGKHIDENFSHKYYDEIGLGIDFTARDLQTELRSNGHPWEKSKAFDNSCLVGNFMKKSQFNDINNIDFELKKNNILVQKGNSEKMIWKIDYLISYISKYFTLKIGDLIFTGTPSGVSKVVSGDNLEGSIQGEKLFSLNIK
ncbi:MAG: fumarylacetoacetate hydrolase family protein [Pelagibacterales bacterium]|nr:fumarylacetoacetate hydrolase family protein [Pelagibacterales bacterium]